MGEKYLIDHDELVNIANAIRNKSKETGSMSVGEMPEKISNLTGETLLKLQDYPDYVRPEVLKIIEKVNKVKQSDSTIFIAMSDNHYPALQNASTNIDSDYYKNKASSILANQAAKVLAHALDIDFFAHLGDTCTGAANTSPEMIVTQITELLSYFKEAKSDLPVFLAIGNHDNGYYYHNGLKTLISDYNKYVAEGSISDANTAANTLINRCPDVIDLGTSNGLRKFDTSKMKNNYCLSSDFVYENFTKHSYTTPEAMGNTQYGGYCYRDFTKNNKNLRVFLLNTSEGLFLTNPVDSSATKEQQKWLAQQLLNLNSEHPTWGFIILCHYPLDYGGENKALSRLLAAYVDGRTITIDDATYDFKDRHSARFIAQFHGHIHNFLIDQLHDGPTSDRTNGTPPPTYNAYRIATPNAQYNRENYYFDEDENSLDGTLWGIKFFEGDFSDRGASAQWEKISNSEKETTFVINVINPSEFKVYSFTYGSGPSQREISYNFDQIKHNVLFESPNNTIQSENVIMLTPNDEPYTTKLIPNDGYTLDEADIQISMGGIDITNYEGVYNSETGDIIISKVSGDIVISAAATKISHFTINYTGLKNVNRGLAPDKIENKGIPRYEAIFAPKDETLIINPYLTRVYMGQEDITAEVVQRVANGYQIKIDVVTDHIQIIMEAYISNLWWFAESVDSSIPYNNGLGYINNNRFGGNIIPDYDNAVVDNSSQAQGYFITGCIPFYVPAQAMPPNITIKGATLNDTDGYIRAYTAYSDKTLRSTGVDNQNRTFSYAWSGVDPNSDGSYTLIPKPTNYNNNIWILTNTTIQYYIRFALKGLGENTVIQTYSTDNKPMFEEPTLHYITYDIGHLIIPHSNVKLIRGDKVFEAKLEDNGKYALDGIPTILMNGEDITATSWDATNRKITISQVTGKVQIIAKEKIVQLVYTNQLPISTDENGNIYNGKGFKENTYISSGVLGDRNGVYTTGFIPATVNDTIYIKNIEFVKGGNNCRIAVYNSDKTIHAGYSTFEADKDSTHVYFTYDENNKLIKITFNKNGSYVKDMGYFRICSPGITLESIITVNERIE